MTLIEDDRGPGRNGSVRTKANTTGNLRDRLTRSQIARVAGGAPEVMMKITGFGKGARHIQAHLAYISRDGDVELETGRGELFNGKEEIKELFSDWNDELSLAKSRANSRDTMHMVLSMPPGTDPDAVRAGVRNFARSQFGEKFEYAFALHTDEPHPHCHLTVLCLGVDGRRINPRKDDLQQWRAAFADAMRGQGVECEATPRSVRGVVRKAESTVVRHIRQSDQSHTARTPKVTALAVREASREVINEQRGEHALPGPWTAKILAAQEGIRAAWLDEADRIERTLAQRAAFAARPLDTNEPPDYDRRDDPRARALQRAGTRMQIAEAAKSGGPRFRYASVSEIRSLNDPVMSQLRSITDAQRRNGTPDRDREGAPSAQSEAALAGRIRAFVAAMPPVATRGQLIGAELVSKFAKVRAVDVTTDRDAER